jgi:hypothetical protein
MGVILTLAGLALATTGLFLLFGAWPLVPVGCALVAAGLAVDWDRSP